VSSASIHACILLSKANLVYSNGLSSARTFIAIINKLVLVALDKLLCVLELPFRTGNTFEIALLYASVWFRGAFYDIGHACISCFFDAQRKTNLKNIIDCKYKTSISMQFDGY